jgi:molybdopterin biosynthesis enzyme
LGKSLWVCPDWIKDEAIKVATGGMVPRRMRLNGGIYGGWITLHIFKTLPPLENVVQKGEDIKAGELFHRGSNKTPDIGLCRC